MQRTATGFSTMLLALVAWLSLSAPAMADAAADEWNVAVDALSAKRSERLAELAAWCDEQKLTEPAAAVRRWAAPAPAGCISLVMLADAEDVVPLTDAQSTAGESAEMTEWRTRFSQLRRQQADACFALAQRAMRNKRTALAYSLAVDAARENPDHAEARRLLGYRRFRGAWQTTYEIRQMSAGKVWNAELGWLPQQHVARYSAGERFYRSRWLSIADETVRRSELDDPWLVETEHYRITTNHSLEAGVALGVKLERLYRAWQQTFPLYLASREDLTKLLEGRAAGEPRAGKQHQVTLFRDRDEYVRTLKPQQPNIDITTGIYFSDARRAYFFAGGEHSEITLLHEATHQLFHETRSVAPHVGAEHNFWIVEGVACYMESLAQRDGRWTLGGRDAVRFQAAQRRLLETDFYIPLSELCDLGMNKLQRHPQIAPLYSQSAGLSYFLMHYDDDRYREALMAYLEAVYLGRDDAATLAQKAGASYAELDKQYREFMEK